MANIRVPATGNIAITGTISGSGDNVSLGSKTITLNTKDTYVYENIDVIVTASANVQAGSLANEASGSTTYSENTDSSTVLPSGGYLYINEGWLPNTKISLSHLIPEIADYDAGDLHILSGYKAYDEAGNVITGTMAEIDPTFSGGTITVTPSVTNLSVPTAKIESTGTFKTASTYGVTTTQPTGTGQSDGTTYLTIDGTISKTDGSVKATAEATRAAVLYNQYTAGHLSKSTGDTALAAQTTPTTETTASATTITPTITDNFAPLYIPIVTASFGGGDITPTASGSVTTAPKVTYSETVSGKDGSTTISDISNFGISAATSTTPGNDEIVFYASGTPTNGTVQATANATSTAVTYTNAAGAIVAHSSATAITPTSTGEDTSNITVTPTAQAGTNTKYKIAVVHPQGTGGGLTVSGGSITNLSGTAPSVTPSATGTFLPSGAGGTYGVTTSAPTGTDGTNYVTITPSGTAGSGQSYTATVNLTYNRAAVTTDAAYKGAVSMASGATLLAAANNQNASRANVSVGSIQATVGSPSTSYYIPIVTPEATGGDLTSGTATFAKNLSTVTPKTNFKSRTNGTDGTAAITESTYGITTSPASSGTYVIFDPDADTSAGTIATTIPVTRAAVSVSSDAGLTDGTGTGISATTESFTSSSTSVTPTIAAGTNKYIPVITVPSTSSVSNSVTNPTVDLTAGAAYGGTGAPSGSVSGFTSTQPSGAYVVITPGKDVTSGTVTSTVSSITINKGITAGGTISGGTDTDNIGVINGTTTNYYVKIYDGSYSVA